MATKSKELTAFGKRLRRYREAAGLSAGELAMHAMIRSGSSSMSVWEGGKSWPSAGVIPRLADALGVTCDELLRGKS